MPPKRPNAATAAAALAGAVTPSARGARRAPVATTSAAASSSGAGNRRPPQALDATTLPLDGPAYASAGQRFLALSCGVRFVKSTSLPDAIRFAKRRLPAYVAAVSSGGIMMSSLCGDDYSFEDAARMVMGDHLIASRTFERLLALEDGASVPCVVVVNDPKNGMQILSSAFLSSETVRASPKCQAVCQLMDAIAWLLVCQLAYEASSSPYSSATCPMAAWPTPPSHGFAALPEEVRRHINATHEYSANRHMLALLVTFFEYTSLAKDGGEGDPSANSRLAVGLPALFQKAAAIAEQNKFKLPADQSSNGSSLWAALYNFNSLC